MKRSLRQASSEEIKNWDTLLSINPYGAEPYQSGAFSVIKASQGWRVEHWVYETSFGPVYALALNRNLAGLGRVVYIPRGPSVIEPKHWSEICRINRQELKDVIVVKMEPPIIQDDLKVTRDDLCKVGDIQKSVVNTVVIELDKTDDELWDSFRQRARRSIRGGRREQLTVSEGAFSPKNVDLMWDLYKETAARAGIKTRPKEYFIRFWREFMSHDQGKFLFVWEVGADKPIAGLFVCHVGDRALYKDGGSRRDTKTHFSHLLHWHTMQYLKSRGIKKYDLGGTPPSDRLGDPTHRLSKLTTFKLSFGTPVTDYIGTYDQILKPRQYKKWRVIERIWRNVVERTPRRDIY